jgi:mono/diheme cytochrome c family protein
MRMRILAVVVSCAAAAGAAMASKLELPAGPGRDLVYARCQTCHDPQYMTDSAGITRDDWDAAIDNMRQYGLRIPADERAKILDYLAAYLGPNPPPATAAPKPSDRGNADGVTVFKENCSACHQANGQGVAGQFPPLAGNADLFLRPDYPIKIVLYGIEGEIKVAGKSYQSLMPPFGHLDDQAVAAVVNYIREAWGNAKIAPAGAAKVDDTVVQAARKTEMSPASVLAYRSQIEKASR